MRGGGGTRRGVRGGGGGKQRSGEFEKSACRLSVFEPPTPVPMNEISRPREDVRHAQKSLSTMEDFSRPSRSDKRHFLRDNQKDFQKKKGGGRKKKKKRLRRAFRAKMSLPEIYNLQNVPGRTSLKSTETCREIPGNRNRLRNSIWWHKTHLKTLFLRVRAVCKKDALVTGSQILTLSGDSGYLLQWTAYHLLRLQGARKG